MVVVLLLVLAFALFIAAGVGAGAPRFHPGWFGAAALALATLWPHLASLTQ